jgi:hypothetical protein
LIAWFSMSSNGEVVDGNAIPRLDDVDEEAEPAAVIPEPMRPPPPKTPEEDIDGGMVSPGAIGTDAWSDPSIEEEDDDEEEEEEEESLEGRIGTGCCSKPKPRLFMLLLLLL